MVTFENGVLSKLCSKDQLELLDSIDHLRLQGINNYVSLPQIIVCGDQSSGKSSVLEAISGVSFPIKSNLCTRFPTELVLRRTPHVSARVSIVPHESRTDSERAALSRFKEALNGFDGLPSVIESAKLAMGISIHGKAFSKDLLRVEVTGPDRPHLTIVDLPGLIHSETKNQSLSDVELIQDVVKAYMREPRSIILAVVSAKNDFANQVVLKLARAADPTGIRTMGVITKPDTLNPGSESEALYVSLAKNQQVEFRLGWHVLKNMDSEKGSCSLMERDREEAEFFSDGAWTELLLSSLGIDKLRGRLSKVLLAQIAAELPSLLKEIEGKFTATFDKLEKLGKPRSTDNEQRLYLFQISQSFQALVKEAVNGDSCSHPFFKDAQTKIGYRQRIRANVRNLNENFASELRRRGHARQIVESSDSSQTDEWGDVTVTTKDAFLDHIEKLMHNTRGRELPGTFNPMIVTDLFREQSRPWESIVRDHVKTVWKAACRFLDLVTSYVADESTSNALKREIIDPTLKTVLNALGEKTTDLLRPHQSGHPITYNHYFTETLQNVRRERMSMSDPAKVVREFFDISYLSTHQPLSGHYDLQTLVQSLTKDNELDMDTFAAEEALDCLNAYYKVALKQFIDDVAIQVIEGKLVAALDNILSPVAIFGMESSQVSRIAGESEDSRAQREQLSKDLEVLGKGLETCKRFVSVRIGGDSVFVSNNSDLNQAGEAENGYDSDFDTSRVDTPEHGAVAALQPEQVAGPGQGSSHITPAIWGLPEAVISEIQEVQELESERQPEILPIPDAFEWPAATTKKSKKGKKGHVRAYRSPEPEPEPEPEPGP